VRRRTVTTLALLAALAAGSAGFVPAVDRVVEVEPNPFPAGACVKVRPVSPDHFCVLVYEPLG
jgi:hypothetical protein